MSNVILRFVSHSSNVIELKVGLLEPTIYIQPAGQKQVATEACDGLLGGAGGSFEELSQ